MGLIIEWAILISSDDIVAQNLKISYEYRYVPDSTKVDSLVTAVMVLRTNAEGSIFYGSKRYLSDSTMEAMAKRGIMAMPSSQKMISYRVVKHSGRTEQEFYTNDPDVFIVKDSVKLKWNLTDDFKSILGYNARRAYTNFRGRRWMTWFTTEIPLSDGPYKFYGLPGLILAMHDEKQEHFYKVVGIEKAKDKFSYPELNRNWTTLSYAEFKKVFRMSREDPGRNIRGRIPDQRDANGNFHSGKEIEREWIGQLKKIYQENNTLLEPNLLKK